MKKWEKLLNTGGKFKMTMSTKVCFNHFAAGYCSDFIYLAFSPPNKRSRNFTRNSFDSDDDNVMNSVIINPPAMLEYYYEVDPNHFSSRTIPVNTKIRYNSLIIELQTQIR